MIRYFSWLVATSTINSHDANIYTYNYIDQYHPINNKFTNKYN
jgi:hypothetical protein